jgi:hypothetical protein
MPGGTHDSSKTRVRPVFDALVKRPDNWIADLLSLPTGGHRDAIKDSTDLSFVEGWWEPREKSLDPPVSLLSWLIRNGQSLSSQHVTDPARRALMEGDAATVEDALKALRTSRDSRGWYIFEGPTCPDVFLRTPAALVVIEGKRTEPTATVDTRWLRGRHQIWRHIDAAWEIRGKQDVYGFFIVDQPDPLTTGIPADWAAAASKCLTESVLRSSFPHRSDAEVQAISRCFLGLTTWQQVCARFDIDLRDLPDQV